MFENLCIPFRTDGAFPDVQDANFIGTNATSYHQVSWLFELSVNNKPDDPSPL